MRVQRLLLHPLSLDLAPLPSTASIGLQNAQQLLAKFGEEEFANTKRLRRTCGPFGGIAKSIDTYAEELADTSDGNQGLADLPAELPSDEDA